MSTRTTTATTDTAPPLRVGVIGLGFAGTTHLDAYTAVPGVEVVALAGQETDRLHELADSRGVPHRYEDWQDLVARDDLDIVSIGVPNALHHPIAVAALESGKHVFCEKPLATTGDQAQEMVDAAVRNDRVLEVAYNHRRRADVQFLSGHLAQRDADGNGPLGHVYHARASWLRRAGIPGIRSWFANKETAGGGPLIDLGSHVLDIALHLLGEPRVVTASAVAYNELGSAGRGGSDRDPVSAATGRPFDVEDFASALLRFEDGSSLQLQASWASYSKDVEDIEVELLGSTGGARLFVRDYATEGTVTLYSDEQGVPTVTRPGVRVPSGHHQRVIEEFLDTIRSGAHEGHHGEFALHRSRVVDAIYASAAAGREMEVAA
ncbi:Gfo/Idh/MocA family oxidoreductase [Curtobacterium sp. 458]|uniref:Gfo/Idh/MocA family protein n=1 Tax=Curtobacterium sp. 458 TaxID=3050069 RepID=UPI0025B3920D|nr:Gfo/Idh/MocA family oxidoreductase [Curtobacterium sp. 458]WJY01136.1 Gfo/Idh/MocA family oxidoreductase [Curtobacterium sp. 458]